MQEKRKRRCNKLTILKEIKKNWKGIKMSWMIDRKIEQE